MGYPGTDKAGHKRAPWSTRNPLDLEQELHYIQLENERMKGEILRGIIHGIDRYRRLKAFLRSIRKH